MPIDPPNAGDPNAPQDPVSSSEQIQDELQQQGERLDDHLQLLRDQSKQLAAQTSLLERTAGHLKVIHHHFVPEQVAERERGWRNLATKIALRTALAVSAVLGMWDVLNWYGDRLYIGWMAKREFTVGREMYEKENNPEVALSFIDRAIELRPNESEYRYWRAYMQGMSAVRTLLNLDRPMNKAELDQAHEALAQAMFLVGLAPRDPAGHILKSQILVALKEFDRAEEALGEALDIEPGDTFAQVRLATLNLQTGKADEALAVLDKVLAEHPDEKWAWIWKGICLAESKEDFEGAHAAYAKALEIDGRFDLAWYNQGQTYLNQSPRQYDAAKECFEKALEINPAYKEAVYGLGMVYGYQDQYPLAHVYLSNAIDLDPAFMTALKWRGIVAGEMARYDEAIGDLGAAIQLNPREADLYLRRARMHEHLDAFDDAIVDLRFALELEPDSARTWMYLGSVYTQAGQAAEALEYFDKAIALDAKYDEAWARKADALEALGRHPEALDAVGTALSLASYRPERYELQRGQLHEGAGEAEAALTAYTAARTADDGNDAAWMGEARMYHKLGRDAEAVTAARKVLELRPQHEEAQALLKALTAPVAQKTAQG